MGRLVRAVAVGFVCRQLVEPLAAAWTLLLMVDVADLFKQPDQALALALGAGAGPPPLTDAGHRLGRQPSTMTAASGFIALKPLRVLILYFCESDSKSSFSSVSIGVNVAS